MDTTKTPAPTAPEADSPADLKKAATDETTAPAAADTAAAAEEVQGEELAADLDAEFDELDAAADEEPSSGVASGASAIVAAGLGLVALSGSWTSRVIGERETLKGQISSATATTTEDKIEALYGNAWHMTALFNGVLSTIALLIAVFVLARPAFGTPGRTLPAWVRSVSWAAVVVAAIGVIAFAFMYVLALPTAPAA
ncbi:hypothetical protein OHA37_11135 [Streptomyces sp. NBC_00335]|uniref:hypothetical protein n=1 Tax=unclassified Streptomyces TaxID=2593676 RepID=UPI00224F7D4C|nr:MULTISPECIES: hypothetical protein [unclassified Streptomyces]MCX5404433.1 hypothetical protein [Streptomyces sp. NBC_00086]